MRRPSGGGRRLAQRLATAKGRTASSSRWLQRQINDPYVAAAKRQGYRSRAAWKLLWLDDKFGFLRRGAAVLDLGAAPGGWAQVAVARVGAGPRGGRVLALDSQQIEPIDGVEIRVADVLDERDTEAALGDARFDVVLSDMAAPSSGHRATDHLRSMRLVEAAFDIARRHLRPHGVFVAKLLQGGSEAELLKAMRRCFTNVRIAKPRASRAESAEIYIVALDFVGAPDDSTA